MKRFDSILLPLDGSDEAARGASCALWLAEKLHATLHVLHAAQQPLPGREALARLHVPWTPQAQVVLHQLPADADTAVLQAIQAHQVDLLVMSARGASAAAGLKLFQRLGTIAQGVIERCPAPVLLLPFHYQEKLPWTSMLVAASGEAAADHALQTATRLACALDIQLTVMHVEDGPSSAATAALGDYADAAYHEYPYRMDEMVKRGLTGCTAAESRSVEQVLLRRGEPATALLEQVAREHASVIALGWHGAMGAGRARVLKRLLEEAQCPLLLVRQAERSSARLKVGQEFDD